MDDFIAISKAGKEKGVFIMHRECGTLVELARQHGRAIGKMKATITHRFKFPADPANSSNRKNDNGTTNGTATNGDGTPGRYRADDFDEFDVDCDCRFIFFCEKDAATGAWRARYVKLFYEKDKVVPVNPGAAPFLAPAAELARYPDGYRHLAAAQARLGYEIDVHLPTAAGPLWDRMYGEMEKWLDGRDVDLFWEHE